MIELLCISLRIDKNTSLIIFCNRSFFYVAYIVSNITVLMIQGSVSIEITDATVNIKNSSTREDSLSFTRI